jgi:hypothetical protein
MKNPKNHKQILVCREKHGTRYFDASTPRKRSLAALKLVRERIEEYYRNPTDEEIEVDRAASQISLEALSQLPEGIRKDVQRRATRAKGDLEFLLGERELYQQAQEALRIKDGELAWKVLWGRRDYEYEDVSLETLE